MRTHIKAYTALVAITLIITLSAPCEASVSAYKDTAAMWELVAKYSPSDEITAAVVAQIYFESFCESNAVGGGYLHGDEYSERVTAFIDEGLADGSSRDDFISHRAGELQAWGYGLLQWVEYDRLCALYDFAQGNGTSIADADMQVRFIFYDLENNLPELWEKILEYEDAADAGKLFAVWYGGTNDGLKLDDRKWMADKLWKEYGE